MIKRILVFLSVFLLFWDTKAQESIQIDTISYSYYNAISNRHQSIEVYKITNNTSDEYLTWIADVPINDTPEHRLVHDYFKKQKGDFNYIFWMYEVDHGRPVSNWAIGVSFVKLIKPQDSFSYVIAKNSDGSNIYNDRIVIMGRKDVEQYIGGGNYFVLKEDLFFPYSSICLCAKPTGTADSDQDEYRPLPKPHHRSLFREARGDSLPSIGSQWSKCQLMLIASSATDSLYCSTFLPKQAFDSTYFMDNDTLTYPEATCKNLPLDSLKLKISEYYLQCEAEEAVKPGINELVFVVDEKGVVRGVFCFVEKEKRFSGKNVVSKVLNRFKNEQFYPAIDILSRRPVHDMVEIPTHCLRR